MLARQFGSSAQRLQSIAGSVSGNLQRAPWTGPASQRFRSGWRSRHSRTLRQLAVDLQAEAQLLSREADEQARASGDSGLSSVLSSIGSWADVANAHIFEPMAPYDLGEQMTALSQLWRKAPT